MSNGSIALSPCVGFVNCVTAHALDRWIERTGSKSRERALKSLVKQLERAEEVELAMRYRVAALLNHDLKPARYLKLDNWIFVVSLDGGLVTVHSGSANRWVSLGSKPSARPKRRRPR
jgi:hypothetical protein